MKQILWFRRDLRINDNALLCHANNKVLPIFIFDKSLLNLLSKDDKRICFLYHSVLNFKQQLKNIGLDLAIFYDHPIDVFNALKKEGFDEVLCSIDFDAYAIQRDNRIEKILPMQRFIDSFILHPSEHLKKDGTPYKVFTPFYKSLTYITQSEYIETYKRNKMLQKVDFNYDNVISLEAMNFKEQHLTDFLQCDAQTLLKQFEDKIEQYQQDRDFFNMNATSKLSVHLRFGLISAKELFNYLKSKKNLDSEPFIRQLFWREFYNYILFHFPQSEFENFNQLIIEWNDNEELFEQWCQGKTGVPIVDAAMIHLNNTGTMHNRLRMIVASFLTKNLFIDWKKGEEYFAQKLLDYEASSNIGSWQWSASTGADASPYFRVFNPYIQSKKFDKEGSFIKSVIPKLKSIDSKLLHIENGVHRHVSFDYPKSIVDISLSRKQAIEKFKKAKKR